MLPLVLPSAKSFRVLAGRQAGCALKNFTHFSPLPGLSSEINRHDFGVESE